MNIGKVPVALRARLGPEATGGLIDLVDLSRQEAREDVIAACTERFDRRLVEHVSSLRVQIAETEVRLRSDMAAGRVEFIRWSFLFWVGQVLAITGVLTVMLRLVR